MDRYDARCSQLTFLVTTARFVSALGSKNIDGSVLCREVNLACFRARAADTDVAIVEGVMGLYDGRDGRSDVGSTAEMAKLLSAPVLLVLDCWTLARSAAAIIRGYTTFDPALDFAGVVFNKVLLLPSLVHFNLLIVFD